MQMKMEISVMTLMKILICLTWMVNPKLMLMKYAVFVQNSDVAMSCGINVRMHVARTGLRKTAVVEKISLLLTCVMFAQKILMHLKLRIIVCI